jgi:hypothetical protein
MPQLDIINFFYLISLIIICFLFSFVSYQKKLLYSWKKITCIIEQLTLVVISFSKFLLKSIFGSFFFFYYILINIGTVTGLMLFQKFDS